MFYNKILKLFALSTLVLMPQNGFSEEDLKINFDFEKIANKNELSWDYLSGVKLDNSYKVSGDYSALLENNDLNSNKKFLFMKDIPFNGGKKVTLKGSIKTLNIEGGEAGIFIGLKKSNTIKKSNSNEKTFKGTNNWQTFEISLELDKDIDKITIGAVLLGKGKVWFDNFELLIDGKIIKENIVKIFQADLDNEFDNGSNINIGLLNNSKIHDLDILGKIWGVVKYNHPNIQKGDYNIDYELIRLLPNILNSKNKDERNNFLLNWINKFGDFETINNINQENLKIKTDLSWINSNELGLKLSKKIEDLYKSKLSESSYYISSEYTHNPIINEKKYDNLSNDKAFKLISLYRYWNIIQYFYPYKNIISEDWNNTLSYFIPIFLNADTNENYLNAIYEIATKIKDSHAFIFSNNDLFKTYISKKNMIPVDISFIEDKAVIKKILIKQNPSEFEIGDIIKSINNKDVSDIVKEKLKTTPASNYLTQLRKLSATFLDTNEDKLTLVIERNGKEIKKTFNTLPIEEVYKDYKEDNKKGWSLINANIGYIDIGYLTNKELPLAMNDLNKTKGIIIDLRNYPSDNIHFNLSQYLIPNTVDFAIFSLPDFLRPGNFILQEPVSTKINKNIKIYKGKIVVLINENTQSSGEYLAMLLKKVPNSFFIGNNTAGADGNVSKFVLPGNISTAISGLGVYYPDGSETQGIGIKPDLEIRPTIKGIKEGKDELIDQAIEFISSFENKIFK